MAKLNVKSKMFNQKDILKIEDADLKEAVEQSGASGGGTKLYKHILKSSPNASSYYVIISTNSSTLTPLQLNSLTQEVAETIISFKYISSDFGNSDIIIAYDGENTGTYLYMLDVYVIQQDPTSSPFNRVTIGNTYVDTVTEL